ncbi:hypothetical protein APA_4365 [Pseudanabaena sp. lw0831]|nr:hypothetical protein APA_4365 [Pseudanabaena sp. lw0831]
MRQYLQSLRILANSPKVSTKLRCSFFFGGVGLEATVYVS